MNNIKYTIVENPTPLDAPYSIAYGIAAYSTTSPETIITYISDITSDKNSLEDLVNLFNKKKLSIIHLNDVIEDFLCN